MRMECHISHFTWKKSTREDEGGRRFFGYFALRLGKRTWRKANSMGSWRWSIHALCRTLSHRMSSRWNAVLGRHWHVWLPTARLLYPNERYVFNYTWVVLCFGNNLTHHIGPGGCQNSCPVDCDYEYEKSCSGGYDSMGCEMPGFCVPLDTGLTGM